MLKRAMSTIAVVLAVLALSPSSFVGFGRDVRLLAAVGAQQTPSQLPSPDRSQGAQTNMANMMKMHEQMMAEMKSADAKLDQLVKDMNVASGEAKIAAIAQVVNELAQQQKSMHERMATMHQHLMMGGMAMMRK